MLIQMLELGKGSMKGSMLAADEMCEIVFAKVDLHPPLAPKNIQCSRMTMGLF